MPKRMPIGPFKRGMDNRSDETALPKGAARELRNYDIDKDGNIERRRGFQRLFSGSNMHSLFSNLGNQLFGCVGNELGVFDIFAPSFTPLITIPSRLITSFVELNQTTYAFNPQFSCRFPNYGTDVFTVGVPLPIISASMLSTIETGGLHEGKYTIAISVVDAKGEESGLSQEFQLDVPQGGGITITGLPVIPGNLVRVYCTTRNGEELYQMLELPMTAVSYSVTQDLVLNPGRQPETMHLEPLPYGHFVKLQGSRLFVAKENALHFSSAFRPHLTDFRHDFVLFQDTIRMVQPVNDGIYVGDSHGVYFLPGRDPDKFEIKQVSDQAPVYGSSLLVNGEDFNEELDRGHANALWLTRTGVQVGSPDGQVYSMHPHQLDLPHYSYAAAAFTRYNGMKQAIFPVNSNGWLGTGTAVESVIH